MAQDDWQRGRHQGGYEYGNQDFNDGARERRNEQAFQDALRRDRQAAAAPPPPARLPDLPSPHAGQWPVANRSNTAGRSARPGPFELKSFAKGLAVLGALGGAAYALDKPGAQWIAVMLYAGLGAGAGALVATAVYVVIKLTLLALKIAAGLLVIGVVLHLLGVIDLPHVLAALLLAIRR